MQRQRVLFVVIDQLRADCLTGALAAHIRLPNLTRFMADAVTFRQHFTVTAPCGPSRASLLTGLYAMNHRSVRNGTPLDNNLTNLALEVRRAGYDPLLFGYTDTSRDPRILPPHDPDLTSFERVMPGFSEQVEMRFQDSFPWRADLKAKGYDLPSHADFYRPTGENGPGTGRLGDPAFYKAEDSDTAFLTDCLLRDLSVRETRSWFAHLTYIRPHPPLVAPAPYHTMVDPGSLPRPSRAGTMADESVAHPFLSTLIGNDTIYGMVDGLDDSIDSDNEDQVQTLRATYLGLALEVDFHFGRIVEYLKRTGQYEKTLIVVTSDHGEMLGDHFVWGKMTIHKGAAHVPLIIRDPDHVANFGSVIDEFTESVDVTPTLLDCLDLPVPASMNGRSLQPFLAGNTPAGWRDHACFELDFGDPESPTPWQERIGLPLREANVAVIRDARFMLAHFNGGLPPLLYDLEADPDEHRNIAGEPGRSNIVLRLTRKLLDHRLRHGHHALSDMKITPGGTINGPLLGNGDPNCRAPWPVPRTATPPQANSVTDSSNRSDQW